MNLENRFPKALRERAKKLAQGYQAPNRIGRGADGRNQAKQQLRERQTEHPEWVVYFDDLPEAVRFIRDKTNERAYRAAYSLVAPADGPGEFGYCAVYGSGFATALWAGYRLVAHETDLTREVLDAFLSGLNADDTDEIEEV